MLDAHAAAFPQAVQIVNFLYGADAPVFMIDEELKVSTCVSSEGPRQGCAAGSYLFCIGVAPLILKLQSTYPDFKFIALTDDINILCHLRLVVLARNGRSFTHDMLGAWTISSRTLANTLDCR